MSTDLRGDVERWAQEAGYTPQMSLEDPETIIDFIGWCQAHHADEFTHAHGTEIFRWCKEKAPFRLQRELQ